MSILNLTSKEKTVFFNMIKHPELNDIELSKKTEIKRSTVTAIRNRLKAEKFFSTLIIPNLPALGCKVMGIVYGKFNPQYPRDVRAKVSTFSKKLEHSEAVWVQSSDTEAFILYFSKDLTDIRRAQDYYILDYEAHDFYDFVERVYFPLDLSNVYSLFDFSTTLARLFNIEIDGEPKPLWKQKTSLSLTNTEKKIFHAIVKYPEANNIEISKKADKTRSTVSKVRKKLMDENLIKIVNIPTLDKLGSELMVFYHAKYNPKSPLKDRKDGIDLLMKTATPIFEVSGDIESLGVFSFRNYTEYTNLYNKILSSYKEKKYIKENPYLLFFPFQQLKWTKLDFASLAEKLLFGKKEKPTEA